MKMVKIALMLLLAVVLSCVNLKPAQADGGIYYPPDYYSAETSQKAFINFADGTENLVVLTKFRGNAKDFVWVIPTPSKPEINKGNTDLFNTLSSITYTSDNGPGIVYSGGSLLGAAGTAKQTPVEVISEKTVDVYDTVVLKATDENALGKWLTDNGYSYPADQSANLKSYVDKGWYFAVAKIKPDVVSGGIVPELADGTLTPLRLTFKSDKIIYPMKLTAVALSQTVPKTIAPPPADQPTTPPVTTSSIPITLYVLSDHKTEQGLLTTEWANWLSKSQITNLNDNLGANVISQDKLFLTKMTDTVSLGSIGDDFTITNAANDEVFPTLAYKTGSFWWENLFFLFLVPIIVIFFPIPLGLIFVVFLLFQYFIKKKWLYILGSIYQLLTCLVLLLLGLAVIAINDFDLASLWQQGGFIGGAIALVALEFLAIYVSVKMLKHYKKTFPPRV